MLRFTDFLPDIQNLKSVVTLLRPIDHRIQSGLQLIPYCVLLIKIIRGLEI